jgi:hypothetical protein
VHARLNEAHRMVFNSREVVMPFHYYKGQDTVMEKLPTQAAEFQACLASVKNVPPSDDDSKGQLWRDICEKDVYVLTTYYTGQVSADLDHVGCDIMTNCLLGIVWTVWLSNVGHIAKKITKGQRKIMGGHRNQRPQPQSGRDLLRNTLAEQRSDDYANNPLAAAGNYANNTLAAAGNYANAQ